MFDLTAGTIERPLRDTHASATVMSVVAHVAIIGGVAWVVLFSVPRHAAEGTVDDGIRRCGAYRRSSATPASRPSRGESRSGIEARSDNWADIYCAH